MTAVVHHSSSNAIQAPTKPTFELIYDADRNICKQNAKDLVACFENGIQDSVTGWKTKDTRPNTLKAWNPCDGTHPKLVQIFKINNPRDRVSAFEAFRTQDNNLSRPSRSFPLLKLDRSKRRVWFGTWCRNKSCRPAQGQWFKRKDNPAHFAHTDAKCPFLTMVQNGLKDNQSISDCCVHGWFGQAASLAFEDRYKMKNILLCDLQPGRIFTGHMIAQPRVPDNIYDIYQDEVSDTLGVYNNQRVLPRYMFRYEQV